MRTDNDDEVMRMRLSDDLRYLVGDDSSYIEDAEALAT